MFKPKSKFGTKAETIEVAKEIIFRDENCIDLAPVFYNARLIIRLAEQFLKEIKNK